MTRIIYAPGVHHGGGLVLLAALCKHWPSGIPCHAFLDQRAAARLQVPGDWQVDWVARSFWKRLRAERRLAQQSRRASMIMCFHNLPPVFACHCPVVCYVQNPNLIGLSRIASFSGWVRIRLIIERFIARTFRKHVDQYVVQTPTMARALKRWLGSDRRGRKPSICRMPFIDPTALSAPAQDQDGVSQEWDFVYVSDGQAHKNHRRLFEAWILLSEQGLRPSLAVTLHPVHDRLLADHLRHLTGLHRLNIVDLGHMPHTEVLLIYRKARAMLFASYAESFGIPFLEAKAAGIPIVAAELDFVRDMCEPAQTFDPFSAQSIARAVMRFLSAKEPPMQPLTPTAFIDGLVAFEAAE